MGTYKALTPYLKKLHFLPVKIRIKFKITFMVFKCMNNIAPDYLSSLIRYSIINIVYGMTMNFICLRLVPLPTLNELKGNLVIRDQEFGMNNHTS